MNDEQEKVQARIHSLGQQIRAHRIAQNLSHLRCNHSKGIRISLLEDLCRELHCQPGDLLVYEPPAREEQD